MSSKAQTHRDKKVASKQRSPQSKVRNLDSLTQRSHSYIVIRRARLDPSLLTVGDVPQLQRTIGNRATARLLAGTVQRQPANTGDEPTESRVPLPQIYAAPRSIQRMQAYDQGQGDRVLEMHNANQVPGEAISVRTDEGNRVVAWRPQRGTEPKPTEEQLRKRGRKKVDGAKYRESLFCHGFSLGTFGRFGYSVFSGESNMGLTLEDEFGEVGDLKNGAGVQPRDLAVWFRGAHPVHSAVVVEPVVNKKGRIRVKRTTVDSKTGTGQLMKNWPLAGVMKQYRKEGKDIHFYRR